MTEDFKKLQEHWYQRLADSGFKDCEKLVGDQLVLRRDRAIDENENVRIARAEYYRVMGQIANDASTRKVDQYILARHAEGITFEKIAKELTLLHMSRCTKSISAIVRRHRKQQPLREWNKRVETRYTVISFPAKDLPHNYIGYVLAKWLKSLRLGNQIFYRAEPKEYYYHYEPFLKKLLAKPDSLIRLAVLEDNHDVVLGFSASREDVLDYVYVHKDYRRIGIAKQLVPEGITTFSHVTTTGATIWQDNAKYKHLKFNPFA